MAVLIIWLGTAGRTTLGRVVREDFLEDRTFKVTEIKKDQFRDYDET